jgi:hypothetical protein
MRPYRARFRGQGVFFAFQSWVGCITKIFGFDLRQAQDFITATPVFKFSVHTTHQNPHCALHFN